jgi:hypothetical protein
VKPAARGNVAPERATRSAGPRRAQPDRSSARLVRRRLHGVAWPGWSPGGAEARRSIRLVEPKTSRFGRSLRAGSEPGSALG